MSLPGVLRAWACKSRLLVGGRGGRPSPHRLFLPAGPTWRLVLEPHALSTLHDPQHPRTAPGPSIRASWPRLRTLAKFPGPPLLLSLFWEGQSWPAPQAHTWMDLSHPPAEATAPACRARCAWSLLVPQTLTGKQGPHSPSDRLHESRTLCNATETGKSATKR